MVPHGGPNNPIYRQVAEVGKELASMPEIAATRPVRNDVGLVFDWQSWWALELPSRPSSLVRLLPLVSVYHRALWQSGLTPDVVSPGADLGTYRLLIVPNLYLTDAAAADNLSRYAEQGGHLVVGFFSGLVDACDRVHPGPYPGALRELLGIEIDQFWPLASGEHVPIRLSCGQEGTGTMWSEEVRPSEASVEAIFAGGPLRGRPALTTVAKGDGNAWYFATLPDETTLATVLATICAAAGVTALVPGLPKGVEALRRTGPGQELLFLLNHNQGPALLPLPAGWQPLAGPRASESGLVLDAQQVAVLCRPKP
jgi:beta-galactosidase